MKKQRLLYAGLFFALLLTELVIALFVNDRFVRPYVGDMLVTLLLCCLCRIFIPLKVRLLPVYVFVFAAAVELGQYFDVVKLLGFENNRFLSVLLGRTFSFADILCYAAGCLISFGIDRAVFRKSRQL